MSGVKSDEVFIKHILDEIGFLKTQSRNLEFEDLMKNEILKRAFPRSIEIIGEATKNISDPLKEKYPEIEWKKIAGMRDKLILHILELAGTSSGMLSKISFQRLKKILKS